MERQIHQGDPDARLRILEYVDDPGNPLVLIEWADEGARDAWTNSPQGLEFKVALGDKAGRRGISGPSGNKMPLENPQMRSLRELV